MFSEAILIYFDKKQTCLVKHRGYSAGRKPDLNLAQTETVADAGHGQNVPGRGRTLLQLSAQIADMHVDRTGIGGACPPDRVEKVIVGEHLTGMAHQFPE